MAGFHDRAAAQSEEAARARIEQIYKNKHVPIPNNIDAQIARVISSGGDYLDQIRQHAQRNADEILQYHAQKVAIFRERNYPNSQANPADDRRWAQRIMSGQVTPAEIQHAFRLAQEGNYGGWSPETGVREGETHTYPGSDPPPPGASPSEPAPESPGSPAPAPESPGSTTEEELDQILIDPAPTMREARAMVPWMPDALLQAYLDAWTELGKPELAMNEIRQRADYEDYFPGIRREDGSLRMTEREWYGEVEGYKNTLRSFGIPPSVFGSNFAKLFENGVNSQEFHKRVSSRYSQIATMGDNTRRFYAEHFGTGDISDAALLASYLDPSMDPLVAQEQFKRAQIGGSGRDFGFDVAMQDVNRLAEFGMNRQAAQSFFSRAQQFVPTVAQLAQRHNDPDDDFDIEEAMGALVFEDPVQQQRIRRLMAQEASSFSGAGTLVTDQQGRMTGLTER